MEQSPDTRFRSALMAAQSGIAEVARQAYVSGYRHLRISRWRYPKARWGDLIVSYLPATTEVGVAVKMPLPAGGPTGI